MIDRILARFGYRKVPSLDVWRTYIEDCNTAQLSNAGKKMRARAIVARKLAVEANKALDSYEKLND
jgi:hypothetical protein